MRQKNAIEHFNLVTFTTRHHRKHEITRTVIAESDHLLPGGAIIGARNMRYVLFKVMLLKTQLRHVDIERFRQQRTNVANGLFALTKTNKVQNFGWIGDRILNFLHQICVAVLTNGNMLNIGNLYTNRIETRSYGQHRKTTKVLVAIQPLLG